MSVLIILCHPSKESFNHHLAQNIETHLNQQQIENSTTDLYQENFNPVLPSDEFLRRISLDTQVLKQLQYLENSSTLIFIHPDWWGGPPAMLKGWIDRVLQPGIAYKYSGPEFLAKTRTPLLTGKKAMVLFTTNSSEKSITPLKQQWEKNIFGFCGIKPLLINGLYHFHQLSNLQKQKWVNQTLKRITSLLKK